MLKNDEIFRMVHFTSATWKTFGRDFFPYEKYENNKIYAWLNDRNEILLESNAFITLFSTKGRRFPTTFHVIFFQFPLFSQHLASFQLSEITLFLTDHGFGHYDH